MSIICITSAATPAIKGVGFVIHKKIAVEMPPTSKGVSDRLAQLTLKINCKCHLNIIQVSLPTTGHTDEEVDIVYEDLDNLITNSKAHFNIIISDFNVKVGSDERSKSCTSAFRLGTGNSRGDSLINFPERHRLKMMNTFFKTSPGRR